MAYSTKYYSDFASDLGVTGRVYFKKNNYAGGIVGPIKLLKSGVKIDYKWKDWFNPIIGQSCSLALLNDSSDYFFYDDLFAPDDYEWQVIVDVSNNNGDNKTIFDGFLNPEPMSARYLNNSSFRLTASGYLNKLDEVSPDILDASSNTESHTFIDLINSSLRETNRDASLYVNMTLEPSGNLSGSVSDTFGAWQKTGISPEVFFENQYDKDGASEMLVKILKPFNSYMYAWDGDWRIERFNDLDPTKPKYYRKYDINQYYNQTKACEYSLVDDPSYNLGDFDQTGYSQQIKVDTTFKTFIVKKAIDEWQNLVINMFDYDDGTLDYSPICTSTYNTYQTVNPKLRKWSVYSWAPSNFVDWELVSGQPRESGFVSNRRGPRYSTKGISNVITRYGYPSGSEQWIPLLTTKFLGTVEPLDRDPSGDVGSTMLNINFKYIPFINHSIHEGDGTDVYVKMHWFIKDVSGGLASGRNHFITYQEVDGEKVWSCNNVVTGATSINHHNYDTFSIEGLTKAGRQASDISFQIPLSDVSGLAEGDREFIFGIFTDWISLNGEDGTYEVPANAYIGDFVITVDGLLDDDTETGTISTLQTKKEVSVDLDIFDVNSLNTPSGIVGGSNLRDRTTVWSEEEDGSTGTTLIKHLINDRFKIYNQKRRSISTNIRTDKFIKPFSIFYDDQDPSLRKYVLGSYSYTPDSDEYKLDLSEWDNTDLVAAPTYRGGRFNDGVGRPGTVRNPRDYSGTRGATRGSTRGGATRTGTDPRGGSTRTSSPTYSAPTGTRATRTTYTSTARNPVPIPMYTSGDQPYVRGEKTFIDATRVISTLYIGEQSAAMAFDDTSTFTMYNNTPGYSTVFKSNTTGDVSTIMMELNADTGIQFFEDVSISKDLYVYGNIVGNVSADLATLTVNNDASILGDFYLGNDLFDISLGGIGSAQDGSTLVYVDSGAYWTYGVGGGGGSAQPFATLAVTGDGSIGANLYVDGSLRVYGNSNLTGGTVTMDTLSVNTYANLYNVDISNDCDVLGALTVNSNEVVDVSLSGSLSNNDVIVYDSTNTEWFNASPTELVTFGTPDSSATGEIGDMQIDATYLYVCVSTNNWMRFSGTGGY